MRSPDRLNLFLLVILPLLFGETALAAPADRPKDKPQPVTEAEYRLYDLVIKEKFLTSQTELVVIDRFTVTKLGPDEKKDIPSQSFFSENQFFEGNLRSDVVTDFIVKNLRPSKLEGRFGFGVRYRFISDGTLEEPEVSLAPIPVSLTKAPPVLGVLGLSRIGFDQRENQALIYVSDDRQDGTGAGFLFLLLRNGSAWQIVDSEVLWSVSPDGR
jgi:hypothetical protein